MWQWFRRQFGTSAVDCVKWQPGLLGQTSEPRSRKGKSMTLDAISEAAAQDGDTVAIDKTGRARVIGRTPKIVIDNTK